MTRNEHYRRAEQVLAGIEKAGHPESAHAKSKFEYAQALVHMHIALAGSPSGPPWDHGTGEGWA